MLIHGFHLQILNWQGIMLLYEPPSCLVQSSDLWYQAGNEETKNMATETVIFTEIGSVLAFYNNAVLSFSQNRN